jgi:hypothetical protein
VQILEKAPKQAIVNLIAATTRWPKLAQPLELVVLDLVVEVRLCLFAAFGIFEVSLQTQ